MLKRLAYKDVLLSWKLLQPQRVEQVLHVLLSLKPRLLDFRLI